MYIKIVTPKHTEVLQDIAGCDHHKQQKILRICKTTDNPRVTEEISIPLGGYTYEPELQRLCLHHTETTSVYEAFNATISGKFLVMHVPPLRNTQQIEIGPGAKVFFMNDNGDTIDRYEFKSLRSEQPSTQTQSKSYVDIPIKEIFRSMLGESIAVWRHTHPYHGDFETIFNWNCKHRTFLGKDGINLLTQYNCPIYYNALGKKIYRHDTGAVVEKLEDLPDPEQIIRIYY